MNPAIGIFGPTASGKSAVALQVARKIGGEIISCDSMQVYRGLDIGTAKPTPAEQAAVPHHLVDFLEIDEPFDVERFKMLAEAAIADIRSRGAWPIVCGGTGYYARQLFYGEELPPSDPQVRQQVDEVLAEQGTAPLLQELAETDPESIPRVEDNPRRLARAVEIIRLTGKPVPPRQSDPPEWAGPQFVLIPEVEITWRRIQRRTKQMLEQGWIEETARLVKAGLLTSPTAHQALGYPEIAAWLAADGEDREELAETLFILTRRYAKRQRTWFRNQHPGAIILNLQGDYAADEVADRIFKQLSDHAG